MDVGPRNELSKLGVKSYRGVRLSVADEPVAVLYLSYKHLPLPPSNPYLEHFAFSAAAALKKNRLLAQIERGKKIAEIVARLMTAGDRQKTLAAVTAGVKDLLTCDIVTLFVYNAQSRSLGGNPSVAGLSQSDLPIPAEKLNPDGVVAAILNKTEPHIADRVEHDPIFSSSSFVRRHGIVSCIALALRVNEHPVGVMFVSSRTHYRPTTEELATIQTCADLAAVAIHNAQLFQEREKEQRALKELSRNLLGVANVQELLDGAVSIARDVLEVGFCEIILADGKGSFQIRSVHGWGSGILGSRIEGGNASQTGFTVLTNGPVSVLDYAEEKRFAVHPDILTHKIRSGLSAPVYRDTEAVGAILIHTPSLRQFTPSDINLLELIANQISIALRRVEQYEEKARLGADLAALWETAYAIFNSIGKTNEREILAEINRAVVERIKAKPEKTPVLGTIQRYEPEADELVFENIYPPESFESVLRRTGGRLSITPGQGRRIGINGRAVREKTGQLVPNVSFDNDYLELDPRTRSQISIPLIYEDTVLGVIAVESDEPEAFDAVDFATLKSLAQLAVVAIHHTRQYWQIRRTKQSVEMLTNAIASNDVQLTQNHVAQSISAALGCDAVTLYVRNPETSALDGHPSMVGVDHVDRVTPPQMFRQGSLVYEMSKRDSIYVSEFVENDPCLGGKRFVADEGIRSCAAMPLRISNERIGVLFVNYRTVHHFTLAELSDISLLADQAAVAIRNAQALTALKRRQAHLTAIHEMGKAITAEFGREQGKLLDAIVANVGQRFTILVGQVFATIQMYDENTRTITCKAAYSSMERENLPNREKTISIACKEGTELGIEAQTITLRRAALISDVGDIKDSPKLGRSTRCQMVAPLLHKEKVIGIISVESPRVARF
jgi:GAF domain-containing protein